MMELEDRKLIAACRNLLAEYEPLLTRIESEIAKEEDSTPMTGADAFDIARKAVRRDALKEGMRNFIGRIKTYGSKNPN